MRGSTFGFLFLTVVVESVSSAEEETEIDLETVRRPSGLLGTQLEPSKVVLRALGIEESSFNE